MGTRSRGIGLVGLLAACAVVGALCLGLAGCQKLFTTSLAKSMARNESLPSDLSVDEAAALAQQVRESGDDKLAGELVGTLVDEIAGTSNAGKKRELEAAAAAAAIVASDATAPLTTLINAYADGSTPSSQVLIALASSIKADASGDIVTACSYLDPTKGVSDPSSTQVPLSATDYLVAAVIIMASITPANTDPSGYAYPPSSELITAKNIINEAVSLVKPGSDGYSLLQSISEKFQLM